MTDYKHLYHLMVDASEKAIEAIDGGNPLAAKKLLIKGEQDAEQIYLETTEDEA